MNLHDSKQADHSRKAWRDILESGDTEGFLNPESFWYWTHTHCMSPLDSFLKAIPQSSFLTLGDGYCAREGAYIARFGHSVIASDVEICLIELAEERGLIELSATIDMNKINRYTDTYGFTFTKESLHHSSTPYVALAEMMRVSKKGVILIEPNGDNLKPMTFTGVEDSGNYLSMFRSDQLVQIGLAAGYRHFAYYYTMVFYGHEDVEAIKAGRIEQEKKRLSKIESNMTPVHRPLLCFMFFNDKSSLDCVGSHVNKVSF